MSLQQLTLPTILKPPHSHSDTSYQERLCRLLSSDLNFHGENSTYASHNFHAFPAKFPPQLPRKFIQELSEPGDIVLDPMAGSGTTVVEAFLAGRRGIGFDIDPMALQLCKVKVTPLTSDEVAVSGNEVLYRARESVQQDRSQLQQALAKRFEKAEREFIDYWFLPDTQLELMALIREIERVPNPSVREFLELVFSAVIITKSGGVSMARDLAHTRPHRVKEKTPRSALLEYRKRLNKNLDSLAILAQGYGVAHVLGSDAKRMALQNCAVDLIITSPPYAANAIDYMRAHKFSLVWLGHKLESLSQLRQQYIGHDAVSDAQFANLPPYVLQVVAGLAEVDRKKAKVLHRYYSEMNRSLAEMFRVLRPGKAAIIVVGSSTMRRIDTQTGVCLGEIGKQVGFELIGITARKLDRDRRMMPARPKSASGHSQIEERMHEEYVIGFLKPEKIGA